jgi:hypothetical protein
MSREAWPKGRVTGREPSIARTSRLTAVESAPELPIGVGHLAVHTLSVATCAASTESNRPTVVIGDKPGGSSRRR